MNNLHPQIKGLKVLTKPIGTQYLINKTLSSLHTEVPSKLLVLASNQQKHTYDVLGKAQFYLLSSGSKWVRKFITEALGKKPENVDEINYYAHKNLLSSVLFYNAAYDYFQIVIIYMFSEYKEFVNQFKRKKVEDKLNKNFNGDNAFWMYALGSVVNPNQGNFATWYSQNLDKIPSKIQNLFNELKHKNITIKQKYHANLIKHGAIVGYDTALDNTLWLTNFISFDNFYTIGAPLEGIFGESTPLYNLKELQDFLVEYNNSCILLLKEICTLK